MNRVLQSSPAAVQQMMMMMGGNPSSSCWSNQQQQQQASPFLPPPPPAASFFPQFIAPTSSSSLPFPNSWHDNQELPSGPWSQLLLGGLVGEEEEEEKGSNGIGIGHEFQVVEPKKFEKYWPEQQLQAAGSNGNSVHLDIAKQENSGSSYTVYPTKPEAANWSVHHHQISPTAAVSSPPNKSCVSSNMLDFSAKKSDGRHLPPPDRSSECNSSTSGGALKKARVQPSATQSTFKVRKEKLGDRITALHQLVSPFGKTDTASVLLETIGYIRFLQTQIEALSIPYFGTGSGNIKQQQQSVQGQSNCIFPEDPGQLLNDHCMKRNNVSDHQQDFYDEEPIKEDLRSRGLCLVPVSCTVQVGNDNGADYWAPAPSTNFL